MGLPRSKVTAQGQVSVPQEVRVKLGIGPGSILEWEQEGEKMVVRRLGAYSSHDVHQSLFPEGPPRPRTLVELKEGIRQTIRAKYARH